MTKFYVDVNGAYIGGFDGVSPPIGAIEVQDPPAHAGDMWDGTAWVLAPSPIPTLNKYEVLIGLLSIGITEADVEAKLALLPADQIDGAMIAWKYREVYRREDQLVATLAIAFNLPVAQVDALWIWARGA